MKELGLARSGKGLPLVSVITPSLGQGRFIEQTILSVKNQRHPRIEHIVVDGGSQDNTVEILRRYQGTYNMRWVSQPDQGMYDAINHGFRMASGEICAYLNSDDVYLPCTVETVAQHFMAHPEIDLVFGDFLLLDMAQRVSLHMQPPFRPEGLRRAVIPLPQPTVFWRRKVYEALGGFDDSLQFAGDWDFWVKAAARFRFGQVHEFLAMTRVHEGAKSVADRQAMALEIQRRSLRYADSGGFGSHARGFTLRLSAWGWRRLHMVRFLVLYRGRKMGLRSSSWQHLLSQEHLALAPWYELLLGFLRFSQRSRYRWTLVGMPQWDVDGFRFERNSG